MVSVAVLWDVYGECRNYSVLSGHKNAVLEVQWTYDSAQIVSASADKTIGVWDAQVRLQRQAHDPNQQLMWWIFVCRLASA